MRKKTILLAEDSPAQRLLLQYAVKEAAGAHATLKSVDCGEEVRRYLEGGGAYKDRSAHPYPDLILLDLNLPGMDGFEVLSYVRSGPEMADMQVIVLSSIRDIVAVTRAYRLGADGYLEKPVNYEVLLEVVECVSRTLFEGGKNLERLRTLPGFRKPPLCRSAG